MGKKVRFMENMSNVQHILPKTLSIQMLVLHKSVLPWALALVFHKYLRLGDLDSVLSFGTSSKAHPTLQNTMHNGKMI